MRGFTGKFQDLDAYAGTIRCSGQRSVDAVAAGNAHFILSSFDVSQACAKGLAFEELSKLSVAQCRAVLFDVPKLDLQCLRSIKGFEDFNPACETVSVLKPIFGLKGAPRAWRKQLHQVLEQWMSCRQLCSEPGLYCVHTHSQRSAKDMIARAKAHDLERQETGDVRNIPLQQYEPGSSWCLLSVHVDDIKGIAPMEIADSLLADFNKGLGQCEIDCGSFLHIGIQHEHQAGSVFSHQYVYVDSITPIDSSLLVGKEDESLCGVALHKVYRLVLGAGSWIVLTSAELAVYVQSLQRRAHAPRIQDCKKLNLATRYMKKRK